MPKPDWHNPCISEELMEVACKLLPYFKRIDEKSSDFDEAAALPTVLIFLPGIFEITTMHKLLVA